MQQDLFQPLAFLHLNGECLSAVEKPRKHLLSIVSVAINFPAAGELAAAPAVDTEALHICHGIPQKQPDFMGKVCLSQPIPKIIQKKDRV